MSVWVTRAAPDNLATARRLKGMGYGSVVVPVIRTRPIDHEPVEGRPDAIVFTSAHAVRHHRRPAVNDTVPVFAVSEGIARVALSTGYANVTSTGGDEEILLGLLAHILPPGGRVVEFCSPRTAHGLSRSLAARGFRVDHLPVYDMVTVDPADMEGAAAFAAGVGGIVIHSRAGARSVRRIIERNGWRGRIWCISPASAAHLSGLNGVTLSCAAEPTEAALLDLVRREALPTRWPAEATADRKALLPVRMPIGGRTRPRPANDPAPAD
ncbi:MAG: uroporphyrinogen-III synthase [Candidatus Sphingomonas phytovorans]|nr:uroporphyrinogen-III synthase [Sphingomonas sp.]WEJ99941.1 MAG: uroporphyrinogen-III synthase [Sphingomonas sp.]